jgi:very-short-patch-repair endonuclease
MVRTSKDYPFYIGAQAHMFKNANTLRTNSTDSEKILWQKLKAKKFHNIKFRRQHPINQFIVDFYCDQLKLVIELDGGYHNIPEIKERDNERESILREWGLNVIRFKNEEIEKDLNSVLLKIKEHIK